MIKIIQNRITILIFACLNLFVSLGCASSSSDSSSSPSDNNKNVVTPSEGMDLYGLITDVAGSPISNVVVSDGFQCVQTDSKGVYQMKRNSSARYVFYSIPSEYQVNTHSSSDKTASFYTKLSSSIQRYDFSLTKLSGGSETNFTMLAIGDPQVSARTSDPYYTAKGESSTITNLNRLKTETMADIASTINGISTAVYGISMGDDCDTGASSLQNSIRGVLGSTSMVTFSVIGNHDQINSKKAYDQTCVAAYEEAWGPINYSFNRGNVHFVALNDVIFSSSDLTSYSAGFTDEQLAWLKQDLSYVPKSKMVVLCYHIPLRNTTTFQNRNSVLELLKDYAGYSLFCGHTHYNEVCSVTKTISTLEHIHGAACGAWWKSTMNVEGTPNGYAVYTINGTNFTDWYYKSVARPRAFQMRLSSADQSYGGDYGSYTYASNVSLEANAGYVVANIFNADANWKVEAYEGNSTIPVTMTKSGAIVDAYAIGYHVGVENRNYDNYNGGNKHLYYYKRTDPNAVVTVVATDEFGNKYTANTFVSDFTEAMHY